MSLQDKAKLSPSRASRRVACPGSRALEELYPGTEESPGAREGKLAHLVATQVFSGISDLKIIEQLKYEDESLVREMLNGAKLYYECLIELGNVSDIQIEKLLNISWIHPTECWGFPDAWIVKDYHLYIWEYKFGHSFVEVFENWQLLEYACGLVNRVNLIPFDKITMTIVQPRSYHPEGKIGKWTITRWEAMEYFEKLKDAENLSLTPNAPYSPSPECNHCAGRHACSALQQSALTAVDVSKSNSPWELNEISTGNELHYLKHAAELLEARITGLSEQAKSMIIKGKYVPWFRLEAGQGRERWTKDIEEIITLGELMGLDLQKNKETITPAQARKLGIPDELLCAYSQRVPGALKLTEIKNFKGNK